MAREINLGKVAFYDERTQKPRIANPEKEKVLREAIRAAGEYVKRYVTPEMTPLDVLMYFSKQRFINAPDAQPALMFYLVAKSLGYANIELQRVAGTAKDGKQYYHSWNVLKPDLNDRTKDTVWDPKWGLQDLPYAQAMDAFNRSIASIEAVKQVRRDTSRFRSPGFVQKLAEIFQGKQKQQQRKPSPVRERNAVPVKTDARERFIRGRMTVIKDADERVSYPGDLAHGEFPQAYIDPRLANNSNLGAVFSMGEKYSPEHDEDAAKAYNRINANLPPDKKPIIPNLMEDSGSMFVDVAGNLNMQAFDGVGGHGIKDYSGPQHPGSRMVRKLVGAGYHALNNHPQASLYDAHRQIAEAAMRFNMENPHEFGGEQQAALALSRITPSGRLEALNVADCRVYVWNIHTQQLRQITIDHSSAEIHVRLLQSRYPEMSRAQALAMANANPNIKRNEIARSVGKTGWEQQDSNWPLQVVTEQLQPGEIVITCTDGQTHDQILSEQMQYYLQASRVRTAQEAVAALNAAKSADNTVTLVAQWNGPKAWI